jgi:hypothetical protein
MALFVLGVGCVGEGGGLQQLEVCCVRCPGGCGPVGWEHACSVHCLAAVTSNCSGEQPQQWFSSACPCRMVLQLHPLCMLHDA